MVTQRLAHLRNLFTINATVSEVQKLNVWVNFKHLLEKSEVVGTEEVFTQIELFKSVALA